jgi:hypothetical protein
MLVLSAVEFGSVAYGSASKTQLKKLDPIHNKGLRIALEAFCINRTQNLFIEAGENTLEQRRKNKIPNMAVNLTTKPEHPINRHLTNKEAPFFARAKEILSMLEVDLKDFDQMVPLEYKPWIKNMEVNIAHSE